MTKQSNAGLALLIVIVVIGGVFLTGLRYPLVKKATDIFFQSFEILMVVLIILMIAGSWYAQRKYPELAVREAERLARRPPNPYRRDLLFAFLASFAGFMALTLAMLYAFRHEGSATSWGLLGLGAIAFAAGLLFALPRLHRFSRHSAAQLIEDLTQPPPPRE